MGEPGGDQTPGVAPGRRRAAPTRVYPASGSQELQRPGHRGVVRGLDPLRDLPRGDRPQGGHRLHRGERQVEPGDRRRTPAGTAGARNPDSSCRVQRVPAVLFGEHLPGHLGADPGPVLRRDRPVLRQPVDLVPRPEPLAPAARATPLVPSIHRERPAQPGRRERLRHASRPAAYALLPGSGRASGWMPCPNRFSICCSVTAPPVPERLQAPAPPPPRATRPSRRSSRPASV